MILTNAKYRAALALMQGESEASPLLIDFRRQAKELYDIDIVDIEFKGKPGIKRLNILLNHHADMHKIGACGADGDIEVRDKLTSVFRKLCINHKVADYSDNDKIFIAFGDMETEMKIKLIEEATPELLKLGEIFPAADICRIQPLHNAIHIFFRDEDSLKKHKNSDLPAQIQAKCSETVSKYDKYSLLPHGIDCRFSSEEVLQDKYMGNIFNYLNDITADCSHH